MPADCIRKTNGRELPSIMGTSGPSSSIVALSIPKPAKADSKCSTVDTEALPYEIVVESLVS